MLWSTIRGARPSSEPTKRSERLVRVSISFATRFVLDIFPFTRRIGGTGTKGRRICAVASVDETRDESEPGRRKKRTPSYRLCSHLLEEVCSRDLVEFALVDDLHCDLLAGENMPGELHDGEMTAAKRLLEIVQAGDLAVVVAVPHPPMHLV